MATVSTASPFIYPRCPPRLWDGGPPPNISENSTWVPVVVVHNKVGAEIWKLCFNWLLVEDSSIFTAFPSFPRSFCGHQYGMSGIGSGNSAWLHRSSHPCFLASLSPCSVWLRQTQAVPKTRVEIWWICASWSKTYSSGKQGGGCCIPESKMQERLQVLKTECVLLELRNSPGHSHDIS